MDAQQALADLTEISSQIRAAVVFDEAGKVAASTLADSGRTEELARRAADLLTIAEGVRPGGDAELTQLEAATDEGSVFVVRQGPTRIAATTGVDPTVGLVFYDLKSALRNLEEQPEQKPKRTARKKAATTTAEKPAAAKKAPATAPRSGTRKKKDAS
jgi:predicted regulator of Ras-like GTPase activity (Roadblock/LC7/MglB family)